MRIIKLMLSVAALLLIASTSAQAYTMAVIDTFTVQKSKTGGTPTNVMFQDNFDDPLTVPNFGSGNPASYSIKGTIDESSVSGKGVMTIAGAGISTNGKYINRGRLLTNTSNYTGTSTDNKGLKKWHSFAMTGQYDLLAPVEEKHSYGIRLDDRKSGAGGNDVISMFVSRNTGNNIVKVLHQNKLTNVNTVLGSVALDLVSGFDQIALNLVWHATTGLTANYEYFNAGAGAGSNSLSLDHTLLGLSSATELLFSDEDYTRAGFLTVAPVPEPQTWLLMGLGLLMVGFGARRKLS